MAAHLADKFVFIKIVGNFTLDKVFKFFTFAQIVDGNNVGNTALVKCFNDVAADKPAAPVTIMVIMSFLYFDFSRRP